MVWAPWAKSQPKSLLSLTDDKPDITPAHYTPEQRAEVLRNLRRATLKVYIGMAMIGCLGIGLIYRQTRSPVIAGVTAAGVFAYMVFYVIKARSRHQK